MNKFVQFFTQRGAGALGHRGFRANLRIYYRRCPCAHTMQNKIMSQIDLGSAGVSTSVYLDGARELSKINRLNHHQMDKNGKVKMYDFLITATPQFDYKFETDPAGGFVLENELVEIETSVASNTWQTRNALKMAHELRDELREEAGVTMGTIGKYARTMRVNLDSNMYSVKDDLPTVGSTSTIQNMWAFEDILAPSVFTGGQHTDGGVVKTNWDYSEVTALDPANTDPVTGLPIADPFFINICGGHSAATPGPYTYVGAILAYNQRRQTVFEESTLTPGGNQEFQVSDSPFFRIPEQDISEDAYVGIILDEQDRPPYDLSAGAISDSMVPQVVDVTRLSTLSGLNQQSWRVQAPAGLVRFKMTNNTEGIVCDFEVECLGTYEME